LALARVLITAEVRQQPKAGVVASVIPKADWKTHCCLELCASHPQQQIGLADDFYRNIVVSNGI
jgi:hypothetical protein